MYQQAKALRERDGATNADQRRAVKLLAAAAGVHFNDSSAMAPADPAGGGGSAQMPPGPHYVLSGLPGIVFANHTHAAASRELAKALQEGVGIRQHQRLALELLRRSASLGDPEAQTQLGMRFAFGLDGDDAMEADVVRSFGEPDEQQALLHYYFAAVGGDPMAQMALGYRHSQGLGVVQSCWTAVEYYQPVAEAVADMAAQPGQLPLIERLRLDVQSKMGSKAEQHKDFLQYYQYSADHGNVEAQTAVGQVLNYGTHGVVRDHSAALHYLQRAANAGDPEAMAHVGHMLAHGLGVDKDLPLALQYFRQAAAADSASAHCALGYLYLSGTAVQQDPDKALQHFQAAAAHGYPDAYYFLGVMHNQGVGVKRKSAQKAFTYFSMAAGAGHLQAMYNTAMMHLAGKATPKACQPALTLLKSLAEHHPAANALQLGHEHFFRGRYTASLVQYLLAAEMGSEIAQSNTAWMLDRGYGHAGPNAAAVAFQLYKRSAAQGNVHSLLVMGDSYCYGTGVPRDLVRAAAIYYAAYQERSAEAMYNLGFMHEFGAGVPKDLQLARRFYAMAAHTDKDATLGMYIARSWLTVHETLERLAPHLPRRLEPLQRALAAALQPAALRAEGPLGGGWLLRGLMPKRWALHWESVTGRLWEWSGLDRTLSAMDEVGDLETLETLLLGFLLVALFFVLKERRRRGGGGIGGGIGGFGGARLDLQVRLQQLEALRMEVGRRLEEAEARMQPLQPPDQQQQQQRAEAAQPPGQEIAQEIGQQHREGEIATGDGTDGVLQPPGPPAANTGNVRNTRPPNVDPE